MFELNEKVKNLKPYEPISGNYPIRLDANESFITLSREMKTELAEEIQNTHFNRYPDPYATEVRQGFAKFYGVPLDCVMAGNGSDEVISVLMNAFLQKGDTVVALAHDFSMYAFYASITECKTVTVEKNADYSIDVDKVIDAVNRTNARMLIFSNPCNPTSVVLPRAAVRKLITSVQALVVLDEAYMDFSDQSLLGEFAQYDNLILLKTCSKAIGLAAIRLGFAVAQQPLIQVLQAVKSPYNVNALTQAVGVTMFAHPDYVESSVRRILESRDELYAGLLQLQEQFPDALPVVLKPQTNFVYMQTPRARTIFEHLKEGGIVVRCMGDALRITAGRNYENEAVLRAMETYFKGETT